MRKAWKSVLFIFLLNICNFFFNCQSYFPYQMQNLNIKISPTFNETFAYSKDDTDLRSIISSDKKIIIGMTTCTYLTLTCKILLKEFSYDFELLNEQFLGEATTHDCLLHIFETSEKNILITSLQRSSDLEKNFLVVYIISMKFKQIKKNIFNFQVYEVFETKENQKTKFYETIY